MSTWLRIDRPDDLPPPAIRPEELLTLTDVMTILHVGKTKLYDIFAAGRLKSLKVGKERIVTRAELTRFIAAEERAGLPARKRRARKAAR